ncbi:PLP-dependent aminotransferase family protein [soil metagenome]
MQLTLSLETGSNVPMYQQLADAIRKVIEGGAVSPGQPLPSSRELAESLAVSRITVRRSYETLASQGYIKSFSRGKTIVSKTAVVKRRTAPAELSFAPQRLSKIGERFADLSDQSEEINSQWMCGAPSLDSLPVARWRECLYAAIRDTDSEILITENDAFGSPFLREEIRKLVFRTRSIDCSIDQIVVFSSTEGGFDLTCRLLLDEGDTVAVEDPGFSGLRKNFYANGLRPVPIPVDAHGICTSFLEELTEPPPLVYVTPSRQDPTGVTLSLERRHKLLRWANANRSIVIEDDFDSEFRYGVQSQASLFSIDKNDLVIYRYNFWKALYPLVRLSFLILPAHLVAVFRRAQQLLTRDVPLLEQIALGTLIRTGYFERHLKSCHSSYKRKRASLVHELTKAFTSRISINRCAGGTSVLVRFHQMYSEAVICLAASQSKLRLISTQLNYYGDYRPVNEFVIDFSDIDESSISETIKVFEGLCSQSTDVF